MPSLKDLKNRIESVKSTRKITKAMQMVAAAKLRRAQEAAEDARPYAERMRAVMAGLAQSVGGLAFGAAPSDGDGVGQDAPARHHHGRARSGRGLQLVDHPQGAGASGKPCWPRARRSRS